MAVRHGEAAAGTEVVLDVDNEKRIALADSQFLFQTEILSFSAKIGGEFDHGIRGVNGIGAIRFKFVQWLFSGPENGEDLLIFPAMVGTSRVMAGMYGAR
jgi:hypothetical protein